MPKTLWNESARQELIERLETLRPDAKARWGKFNAPEMLAHIGASMRMSTGEIVTRSKNHPIRHTPLKQIVIYLMPFPKGAPTAPELLTRRADNWEDNVADVRSRLQSFGERDRNSTWPKHPLFGALTPRSWGVLGYRHTDHHFRQFGV